MDRKRLDPFSPKDFFRDERDFLDFEEARHIQKAGLLVSEMRKRAGFTVEWLAERLHVSPEEVVRIENGQLLESPSMSLILEISEICNQELIAVNR